MALPVYAFAGMFVAITKFTALWSQEQWNTDLASMAAAGFTTLVVPHTGRQVSGPTKTCDQGLFETYYPPPDSTGSCYKEIGDLKSDGGTIGNIFRAAKRVNLTVHLGLMFAPAEHGFPSQHRNGTFKNWGDFQGEKIATHLWSLYAAKQLVGFYTEIEFNNGDAWMQSMTAFGSDYLGGIARAVHNLPAASPGAPTPIVWASPYSILNMTRHPHGYSTPPFEYAKGMRAAIDAAGGIDYFHHVAMQDSMGAQGNSFQDAASVLGNMSTFVPTWANVELFEIWPRSCEPNSTNPCHGRHPAPFSRIVRQMNNEGSKLGGPEAATLIAWEWYSCFSPNAIGDPNHPFPKEARANYNAYIEYLNHTSGHL